MSTGAERIAGRAALMAGGKSVKPCPHCKGRGWHVGECHPREDCGGCDALGVVPVELPAKLAIVKDPPPGE